MLLDPNTLSEDGTVALNSWSVSPDGRWLAYAVSASGSDWQTWRIRDVESSEDLPDQIAWSKFSGAEWQPDGQGFYYGRYEAPQAGQEYQGVNDYQKLYFHRLGDLQQDDRLVYERPDQKEWGFSPQATDDGRYLILSIWQGTDRRNRLFYIDIQSGEEIELIPELEAAYQFVGNDGPLFYLYTDLDAPRGRLIAIDTEIPARQNWQTLISESEDVLEGVTMGDNQFVALYMHHAAHQIHLFQRDGAQVGNVPLPALGSLFRVDDLGIHCRRKDNECFFAFQSFTFPTTVYRYDFKQNRVQTLFKPAIDFDPLAYETRQVIVTSKDGTLLPMFLVHRPNLQMDGQNPTLLYGYGGFNIPISA